MHATTTCVCVGLKYVQTEKNIFDINAFQKKYVNYNTFRQYANKRREAHTKSEKKKIQI